MIALCNNLCVQQSAHVLFFFLLLLLKYMPFFFKYLTSPLGASELSQENCLSLSKYSTKQQFELLLSRDFCVK